MKKLRLMDIFEGREDLTPARGVRNPNTPPRSMSITPSDRIAEPAPTQNVDTSYETEGDPSEEQGGDAPWASPNQAGQWQQSQIPNSPQAGAGIEDFSQSLEQDSPIAGKTGQLRPQPAMQPNPQYQQANPWGPNNGGVGAADPHAQSLSQKNVETLGSVQPPGYKPPPRRKPMRIPIK